jgi:hypothetical protein
MVGSGPRAGRSAHGGHREAAPGSSVGTLGRRHNKEDVKRGERRQYAIESRTHPGPSWLMRTLAIGLAQLRLTLPSNVVTEVLAVAPLSSVTSSSNRGSGAPPSTPSEKRSVLGFADASTPMVRVESLDCSTPPSQTLGFELVHPLQRFRKVKRPRIDRPFNANCERVSLYRSGHDA